MNCGALSVSMVKGITVSSKIMTLNAGMHYYFNELIILVSSLMDEQIKYKKNNYNLTETPNLPESEETFAITDCGIDND